MAGLTTTAKQAIENVLTLRDYRKGSEHARAFHNRQIKNGKLFVAVKRGRGYAFAPSKFAGYKANSVQHEQKISSRDGRKTNVALKKIFGAALDIGDDGYAAVDQAFQSYCAKAGIEPSKHHRARRYWLVGKSPSSPGQVATSAGGHQAIAIFTYRSVADMVKAGGCYAYVLDQTAAEKCKYLVCIRNGRSKKQKEHDVPHSHAFLIAPIDSIEPYSGNRKIIKFSRHVLVDHFVQWGRQIGRVDKSYGTLRDFGCSKPTLVAAVRGERGDADFDAKVKESLKGGADARRKRLAKAPKKPKVVLTTVSRFERNPDVVAEVLEAANGVCDVCSKPAPFQKRLDGTPYLEVHHVIPLAQGGEDTVENALAACPNCHRKAHYG